MTARQRNFHVPLPDDLYAELRTESESSNVPATALARQAIEHWLRMRRRAALRLSIATYAKAAAGTGADLDRKLEAASIAHLLREQGRR